MHQTITFVVALADMGETRRCRIKINIHSDKAIAFSNQPTKNSTSTY